MKFLNLFLAAAIFSLFSNIATAQTLFTYANKSVSKQDFIRAYQKNNIDQKPSAKSYREYLELYTRFKLKVEAALDLGLDTLDNQKAELQNFRMQIAESFVRDDEAIDQLVKEAFNRGRKDIRVAHIFIPANASPDPNKSVETRISKAYETLATGKFEDVAMEFSADSNVKYNKGDIGYITAFVLPYEIENIVYSTPVGKYSKPYKSANGYHIFKNLGERPAIGNIKVAHILLAFPPGADERAKDSIRKKANEIVQSLRRGGDFKAAALSYSSDNLSFQNGGELPPFGVGKHHPAFEAAAFALKNDNAISDPVLTDYGYHIIKRLSHLPPVSKLDEDSKLKIQEQVFQNDRMEIARAKLMKSLQQKTGFQRLPYNQKSFDRFTDSVMQHHALPQFADFNEKTPLFSFTKEKVTVIDWLNYLESIRGVPTVTQGKKNEELFLQFIDISMMEYYRNHLEEFNPQFVAQLNEFREGNLLFEIMQRNIWDAAAADSAALKKFYEENKNNYWWEPSADAIIVTVQNEEAAATIKAKLKADPAGWKALASQPDGSIQADSARFELNQIPVVDRTNFTEGLMTSNVKNQTDNTISFAYIIHLYNSRSQRTFDEARGFVINDYQEYLESKWIDELKKKYNLKVNEAVLKTLK